jgi:hypothetical protein
VPINLDDLALFATLTVDELRRVNARLNID